MKYVLYSLSLAGLLMTIIPPFLYFKGAITFAGQNTLMLVGFFAWFLSAWFWLGKRAKQKSEA